MARQVTDSGIHLEKPGTNYQQIICVIGIYDRQRELVQHPNSARWPAFTCE